MDKPCLRRGELFTREVTGLRHDYPPRPAQLVIYDHITLWSYVGHHTCPIYYRATFVHISPLEHSRLPGEWLENGDVAGEPAAGHRIELQVVWNYVAQYGSHWALVAIEHLNCGCSKLRCAVRGKYIPDVKDLVQERRLVFLILLHADTTITWIYCVK